MYFQTLLHAWRLLLPLAPCHLSGPVPMASKQTNRVVFYKQLAARPFAKIRIENIIFTREPYMRNSLSYLTFSCGVLMLSTCAVMSKSSSKTTPRPCAAISSSRIHGEQDSRFHCDQLKFKMRSF